LRSRRPSARLQGCLNRRNDGPAPRGDEFGAILSPNRARRAGSQRKASSEQDQSYLGVLRAHLQQVGNLPAKLRTIGCGAADPAPTAMAAGGAPLNGAKLSSRSLLQELASARNGLSQSLPQFLWLSRWTSSWKLCSPPGCISDRLRNSETISPIWPIGAGFGIFCKLIRGSKPPSCLRHHIDIDVIRFTDIGQSHEVRASRAIDSTWTVTSSVGLLWPSRQDLGVHAHGRQLPRDRTQRHHRGKFDEQSDAPRYLIPVLLIAAVTGSRATCPPPQH
jgi:hypothetical protein